jgi:arabinogalactan oligomer/maltooligosaccharide transport system permease protein
MTSGTTRNTERPDKSSGARRAGGLGRGFWIRLFGLALVDAVAVYSIIVLIADEAWLFLGALIIGTLFVNWVYLSPRTRALKWITPGLIFMISFMVVPILYTFYISLTNWETGNVLQKAQVIENLESRPYVDPNDPGELFDLYVYQDGDEIRFLLINDEGSLLFGEPRERSAEPLPDAAEDPVALGVVDTDGDGVPEMIGTFTRLEVPEVFALAATLDFENQVLDLDEGQVEITGLSQGRVVLAAQRYAYDEERDVLLDLIEDQECRPGDDLETTGNFVCEDGTVLSPGWVAVTGFNHYIDVLTNESIRGPFLGVFVWNVVFALGSVVISFSLGLILALALQHDRVRGRTVYRSIYILPYAIPGLLSMLIWVGLLNEQFGAVNDLLAVFGIEQIPWLTDGNWAKVSLLLVNMWLTFPYMFLISTGALQAIPAELQEAARVDGANGWKVFWRITFPLLMVSLAPLLIASFAFAFNNFVLVFVLTNGGPPILDAAISVGSTDILITLTYDIALAGGVGNRFALAAAMSIFIFFIVLIISSISFRFTKRLEEIYGSL